MPSKRILIPESLFKQDFWKEKPFSFGQAVVDLIALVSEQKLSVDSSFFTSRWGWESNQIDEFIQTPYIQEKFKFSDTLGLISIEKKNVVKTNIAKKTLVEDFAEHFLKEFNTIFGTGYRNYNSFLKNLEYWLEFYEPDEIIGSVHAAKSHEFWNDKMKPTILFRRKSPSGENVDYIGDLLNSQKVGKAFRRAIDIEDRTM